MAQLVAPSCTRVTRLNQISVMKLKLGCYRHRRDQRRHVTAVAQLRVRARLAQQRYQRALSVPASFEISYILFGV